MICYLIVKKVITVNKNNIRPKDNTLQFNFFFPLADLYLGISNTIPRSLLNIPLNLPV